MRATQNCIRHLPAGKGLLKKKAPFDESSEQLHVVVVSAEGGGLVFT